MATVCAYCQQHKRKLTREHIWPACIIKRCPTYTARYSERAGKVFAADAVISDVCAECNGGPLSELDAYICRMYDRWFAQFPDQGQWIDFDYDWSMLGRWLLKISFNAARANKSDDVVLAKHVDTILGTDRRPPDMAIWLDLAEPTYFEKKLDNGLVEAVRVPPMMNRVCRMNIPNVEVPNYTIRLVAINAFYFYMAIPNTPYGNVHKDLEHPIEFFSLMATLDPDKNVIRANTTGLSTELLIRPHMEQNRELYDSFFSGQNDNGGAG